MTTKDDLVKEIDAMSQEIDAATEKLNQGELVTLDGIEIRVQETMNSLADLPPDDAVSLRPTLVAFLEKMEAFAQDLQSKIDAIHADAANAPAEDGDGPTEPGNDD